MGGQGACRGARGEGTTCKPKFVVLLNGDAPQFGTRGVLRTPGAAPARSSATHMATAGPQTRTMPRFGVL